MQLPDPDFDFIWDVAIAGDTLVVGASKHVATEEGGPMLSVQAAYLYERDSSGTWRYRETLLQREDDPDFDIPVSVAISNTSSIIAVNLGGSGQSMHVFERGATGWVQQASQGVSEGTDVDIYAGEIFASDGTCSWDANQYSDWNSPQWRVLSNYTGAYRGCDDDFRGGDLDANYGSLIVGQPSREDFPGGAAYVYQIGTTAPSILTNPVDPSAAFGQYVAMGNGAFITGETNAGLYHFLNIYQQGWTHVHTLRTPDGLMSGFPGDVVTDGGQFVLHNRIGGVAVWQYYGGTGPGQEPRYVALLEGVYKADVSGNRVAAIDGDRVSVFELPDDFTQPALRQDNFEDGNAAGWFPQAGSAFTVVSTANSFVYRQSSLAGNSSALLGDATWTDQAIQADITPRAFEGTVDRWFGLVVRYTDASNYYYVTARRSNVIEIRRMVNGAFRPLASAAFTMTLNRAYNVRLEAVGTKLRLYVDNKLVLQATDTAHAQGRAGVMMYRTRADYDNVIVSPARLTTLVRDNFESGTSLWQASMGSWGIVNDGTRTYMQHSLASGGRAVTGVATGDQIVQTRVKAVGFGTSAEAWFGLMAHHVDDANYHYVTVRRNNTIALRKQINGVIHVLDSAPFTVTTGTWYTLRLETVGDQLRVSVNGKLLLEATDTSMRPGRYGLATYQTAARYDDFVAVEP